MATSKPRRPKHGNDARQRLDDVCETCRGSATCDAATECTDAAAAITTGGAGQRFFTSELATPKEAAKYLRTTVGRLANDRHHGVGPSYVKYGRSVLYPWDTLRAFIEERTIGDD